MKIILQLKQIRQDMEHLREDKSHLEVSFSGFSINLANHVSFDGDLGKNDAC